MIAWMVLKLLESSDSTDCKWAMIGSRLAVVSRAVVLQIDRLSIAWHVVAWTWSCNSDANASSSGIGSGDRDSVSGMAQSPSARLKNTYMPNLALTCCKRELSTIFKVCSLRMGTTD